MQLYDLAGENLELRFSPFCWRAKMALRHKGLDTEILPWRFTEKDQLASSSQGRVPVLVDQGSWIHDSWQIACYLDEYYPEFPPLVHTDSERALARFLNFWVDQSLHPVLRPMILMDIYNVVAEKDRQYFRQSREAMLGVRLEEACPDREVAQARLEGVLTPMESTLRNVKWLSGVEPGLADYIVFGSLQWANVVSSPSVFQADSAIGAWFERMLDLFDGYARGAVTVRSATAYGAGSALAQRP